MAEEALRDEIRILTYDLQMYEFAQQYLDEAHAKVMANAGGPVPTLNDGDFDEFVQAVLAQIRVEFNKQRVLGHIYVDREIPGSNKTETADKDKFVRERKNDSNQSLRFQLLQERLKQYNM